jgi:hypothetical protein
MFQLVGKKYRLIQTIWLVFLEVHMCRSRHVVTKAIVIVCN